MVKLSELIPNLKLDRYKIHDIEIVVDRLLVNSNENSLKRIKESLITAMYHGNNSLMIINEEDRFNFIF